MSAADRPALPWQILSPEFHAKYDVRGPRYTSYPTVPFWSEQVDGAAWTEHLHERGGTKGPNAGKPLALYVHIPFCRHHCAYCACNVIVTSHEGIASRYLDSVEREIALVADMTSAGRDVIQIHLGGGTPNYLNSAEMTRLLGMLRGAFKQHPEAEISIEVDPRVSSREEIRRLHEVDGFNRISFGVQDFNEATQEAIGRSQTYDITLALVDEARRVGFHSINVDLIYGLPEQSRESWQRTIDRFLELAPSRLAVYNFAFFPGKLANHRRLNPDRMPSVAEKMTMFLDTNERLLQGGYRFIGFDHYARENDLLTRALDDGTLHRNFMGYTTLRGTDMLAFGVSAISDAFGGFSQNTKKLSHYEHCLAEGSLPIEQGLVLDANDLRRQWIIETLLCSGLLSKAEYEARFGGDFDLEYSGEIERLAPLQEDGLLELEPTRIAVTTAGRFFLRNIAMAFDAYLPGAASPARGAARPMPVFSRTL